MDHQTALQTLAIEGDVTLTEVEEAFDERRQKLTARLGSESFGSTERNKLDAELQELTSAVECLRKPQTSVERAGAAMLAHYHRAPQQSAEQSAAETAAANHDRISRMSAPEKMPSANDSTIDSTAEVARARIPFGRIAVSCVLLVAVVVGALILARQDGTVLPAPAAPVSEVVAPVDSTAVALQEVRRQWLAAQEELRGYRVELASVTPRPGDTGVADEWQTLFARYVADETYLKSLDQALAQPLPLPLPGDSSVEAAQQTVSAILALSDDAAGRLTRLQRMEEAAIERRASATQTQRLRNAGVPEWPLQAENISEWFADTPPGKVEQLVALQTAADADFKAGRFQAASSQYKEARAGLATLQVLRSPLENEAETLVREYYLLGLQAISRYQLSTPVEGSALYFVRRIEALGPEQPEAAELLDGIQRGYVELVHIELERGNRSMARRYADLALAMNADASEIESIYAGTTSTTDTQ